MGVEEALQTNETVDIFQEESLTHNGVREANSSGGSQMFTNLNCPTPMDCTMAFQKWPLVETVETVRAQLMFGLIKYQGLPIWVKKKLVLSPRRTPS